MLVERKVHVPTVKWLYRKLLKVKKYIQFGLKKKRDLPTCFFRFKNT